MDDKNKMSNRQCSQSQGQTVGVPIAVSARECQRVKSLFLRACLVAFCVTCARTTAYAQGRFVDEFEPVQVELADYLLDRDFVAEASLSSGYDDADPLVPVHVERMLLGSIPNRTIYVHTLTRNEIRGLHLRAGSRVVVWGSWEGTEPGRSDTCYGNLLHIDEGGGLRPPLSNVRYQDHIISKPGTWTRVSLELAARVNEHVTSWLEKGIGITTARVIAVTNGTLAIEKGYQVAGAAGYCPIRIVLPDNKRCRYRFTVGDSLLVPVFSTPVASVESVGCLERARFARLVSRTPFGLMPGTLGRAWNPDDQSERVPSFNGIRD